METEMTTYEPDNSLKKGYLAAFAEILDELVRIRWLTYQLFKRAAFAVYKQSFTGVLMIFLGPVIFVGTFAILKNSGKFDVGTISAPYPIFAILGITCWRLFQGGLVASTGSLAAEGAMITRINFSKKSLVLASAGQTIMSFLITLILVIALFVFYRITGRYAYSPRIGVLWFPVSLIPLFLLTIGLGFILALLNAVMRDIGNVISSFLTFLMLLTPVLYAKPESGFLKQLSEYNPLYYLISAPRDLVLTGGITEWRGFLISGILSIVVFIVCIFLFHLTETRISERI